jgi:conjugative relaxase-like TrwC/TraI family protein
VCGKEFLFTAAKIKATRGKGTDFYQQHLSNNDYYSEHDRVVGIWSGSLAEEFGLQGEMVDPAVFSLFQQNLNPVNHRKLTPRNNPHSVRFYDFQCSAQKSVSVMSMFDPRLAEAHRRAVKVGMAELEKFAAVRIRKGDNYATKNFAFTGKIIYAEYHHDNSRLLDPQIGQRRK